MTKKIVVPIIVTVAEKNTEDTSSVNSCSEKFTYNDLQFTVTVTDNSVDIHSEDSGIALDSSKIDYITYGDVKVEFAQ